MCNASDTHSNYHTTLDPCKVTTVKSYIFDCSAAYSQNRCVKLYSLRPPVGMLQWNLVLWGRLLYVYSKEFK